MSSVSTGISIAKYINKRPGLKRMFQPLGQLYLNLAGYRKMGLKYDDLFPEEFDHAQKALKRLPPRESYDRVFRIRTAVQCSLSHKLLPKDEQIQPEEDVRYFQPYLKQAIDEVTEREDFDALRVEKRPLKK